MPPSTSRRCIFLPSLLTWRALFTSTVGMMSVAATTIDSPESEFELSHHEVDPYSPPPRTVTSIVNALSGEWLDVGHFRKGLHDERRIYKATETTKRVYHKIDNPHFEIAGSDTVQLPLPKKRPAFPSWVRHDELFFWADPDYYAHLFQWWGEILQEIAGFGLRCLSKVGSVLPRTSGPTRRFVERAELALGIRHVKRYKTESIPWKRVPGRIIDFDAHDDVVMRNLIPSSNSTKRDDIAPDELEEATRMPQRDDGTITTTTTAAQEQEPDGPLDHPHGPCEATGLCYILVDFRVKTTSNSAWLNGPLVWGRFDARGSPDRIDWLDPTVPKPDPHGFPKRDSKQVLNTWLRKGSDLAKREPAFDVAKKVSEGKTEL